MPILKTIQIIAAALLCSTVMYVIVAFMVLPAEVDPAQGVQIAGDNDTMVLALSLASVFTLTMIPVLRRLLLGQIGLLGIDQMAVSRAEPAAAGAADLALATAQRRYQTGTIVGMALGEAVVIYGLTLAFLDDNPLLILPFFVLGSSAMMIQFPRASVVLALAGPAAATAYLARQRTRG